MRFTVLALAALSLAAFTHAENYVVIVCGGDGFFNYGLQADLYHAYHLLLNHGIKPENLISMAFDDVAFDYENPFPGLVFNAPDGKDVYAGVKLDYTGYDVSPENFLAIITGQKDKVRGGNGRVLETGPDDNVFLYYVDHGMPGGVVFPSGFLSAEELNDAIQYMHDNKKYKKLLVHIDACYSGSMFDGILPDNINAYAMTAANSTQVAYFNFCNLPFISVCLGTSFSYGWISHSTNQDLNKIILGDLYQMVHDEVDTSNVSNYGDYSLKTQTVATFYGGAVAPPELAESARATPNPADFARYHKHEVPIRYLETKLRRERDAQRRDAIQRELGQVHANRRRFDAHLRRLIDALGRTPSEQSVITNHVPERMTRPHCHHQALHAYNAECLNVGRHEYAQKVAGPLMAACELGIPVEHILGAIRAECAPASVVTSFGQTRVI